MEQLGQKSMFRCVQQVGHLWSVRWGHEALPYLDRNLQDRVTRVSYHISTADGTIDQPPTGYRHRQTAGGESSD
jgi:hypothetical protein